MDEENKDDILTLEDKRKLNLTASIRENIITTITAKGIPEDKDMQTLLIKALDGLDNNTLSQAKLRVDKNNKDKDEMINALVSEFLMRSPGRVIESESKRETIPTLDDSFVLTDVVPGEKDIGTVDLILEEIQKNTGRI